MSGVKIAPTMKPPATKVVAIAKLIGWPGGGEAIRSARLCWRSTWETDHRHSRTKAGTVAQATQLIEANPRTTM